VEQDSTSEEADMEYLVTMTTHVPDGVSAQDVDDVRAREAQHTQDLAREGRVLRLWRPPLRPGEWRTLGLLVAADADDLEQVLASMPLRVWRTDEATALTAHPNDPGRNEVPVDPARTEFLTTFTLTVPPGSDAEVVADLSAREAQRASTLAAEGHLLRLWRLPGAGRNLGHWQAEDAGQMRRVLGSLPLAPWLAVETVPLSRHPNDPALVAQAPGHGG
jgi:muconolactone delta-isomerase